MFRRPLLSLAICLVFGRVGAASTLQAGDRAGEEQPELPADLAVPPAPVLSTDAALGTFELPPGLAIELVAAEPLVEDPVQAVFDGQGRLWVCEMRGYMPDVDGRGEEAPVGVIAVLEDTDGDGAMDSRRVFLDELVLPRALAPCEDGALVLAPPELFFARDTDGDGRADEREPVLSGLGGLVSPEHAENGLLYTHRNFYRLANSSFEVRRVDGAWATRRTAGGGQWGITQDDAGRVFFDTNPDPLRGDLFPSHYAVRNPNHGSAAGVNRRIAHDFEVFPARMNPGVNRGYHEGLLRDDYSLSRFTAACGPWIYRGDLLPELRGEAFVCEPSGNLIQRFSLTTEGLALSALPVNRSTPAGPRAFLTSTDERFRPVNLCGGPDGALYVVDMYRGVIQHRIFVTSFLRRQIEERALDRPLGLGRIWRIVPAERELARAPALSELSWTELVACLTAPNGWLRDTAQRVIVEEGVGSADARELLRELVLEGADELGRCHALYALSGIGGLDAEFCKAALADPSEAVRLVALQVSEPFLGSAQLVDVVYAQGKSSSPRIRHQVLLSLGEAPGSAALLAMARLLAIGAETPEERSAVLSGLRDRELAFLELCLASREWRTPSPGRETCLTLLSRAIVREGRGAHLERLFGRLASHGTDWQRAALVQGVREARPKGPQGEPDFVRLGEPPRALAALLACQDLAPLLDVLAWPGKPGLPAAEPVRPLNTDERALFTRGAELYGETCASCHQTSGRGEPGKAPSLRGSTWVLAAPERLVRILHLGLVGPLEHEGRHWDGEMPALVASDRDLAAVATYVRREWGHGAEPVSSELVREVRTACRGRTAPWEVEELMVEEEVER